MGSSPGGNYSAPAQQGPPIEQLNPAQPAPVYPQFIQGTGMQTGLTPEMLAQINQPPVGPPSAAAPGGAPSAYQQLLGLLQQRQGGAGGGPGGGMPQRPLMGSWLMEARRGPQLPNIPAPTAGAGGLVAPDDVAAYNAARSQQDTRRAQLSQQMMRNAFRGGIGGGANRR